MGQCPSREKYLEYFSKFGFLMFLMTQSGDLFAGGRSSHKGYTDFHSLDRDSFVSGTSSHKKRLENFSKVFLSSVLAASPCDFFAT